MSRSYMRQSVQEWIKWNLWETALDSLGPFLNTLFHMFIVVFSGCSLIKLMT